MTDINFYITENSVNSLTWEEYEAFERAQEGQMKLYQLRPVLARFMTNGDNKPLGHEVAMKILARLPLPKIKEAINLFMQTLQDSTIPKVREDSSKLPSAPEAAVSESPAGAVS